MVSYFLYNFILIGCFVFSYLAEKLNTKYSRFVCRLIVFLILTIPASLRYHTGTDYASYTRIFFNTETLMKYEFLWKCLNNFTILLNLPVQFIFIFSAILIYYPICFKLKRKNYCLSIILYIILFYYFKSYNIIRQMISVSFVIWALIKFEYKQYIKALIIYLIAVGFHKSSIIVLPCFFISFITIRGKRFPFILLLCCVFLCFKYNCLEISFNLLSKIGSTYSRFQNNPFLTKRTVIHTGLGILSRLTFSILAIIFYKKIRTKHPEKIYLLNLSLIFIISYVLAAQYNIFGRVRDVFIFVPILTSGFVFECFRRYKKMALLLLLFVNTFLFEMDIQKSNRLKFSNQIYPYFSIFYEGEIQ